MDVGIFSMKYTLLILAFICKYTESSEYIGCLSDERTALNIRAGTDQGRTIDNCRDRCQKGYYKTYAGVRAGTSCFCGDNHHLDTYDPGDCSTPCAGNASQICGGRISISVYTVCPRGYYRHYTYQNPHNCDYRCHCLNDAICSYQSGYCPSFRCAPGWRGYSCEFRDCGQNKGGCQQVCKDNQRTDWCDCNKGYNKSTTDPTRCDDINECVINNAGCPQRCVNNDGSYSCECYPGYIKLSTFICHDINECAGSHDCAQWCHNTNGSYTCSCRHGYQLGADGRSCHDIDECKHENGGCEQICVNRAGEHYCDCRIGYLPQGASGCVDIDECVGNDRCEEQCVNTPGSYHCACSPGFQVDQDLRSCVTCPVGQFGENCSQECHCSDHEPCNGYNGTCALEGCLSGYTGASCSEPVVSDNGGVIAGAVIGAILLLVILVSLILLLILFLRRRYKDSPYPLRHIFIEPQPVYRQSQHSIISTSILRNSSRASAVKNHANSTLHPDDASQVSTELTYVADDMSLDTVDTTPNSHVESAADDEHIYGNQSISRFIKIDDVGEFVKKFDRNSDLLTKEFEEIPLHPAKANVGTKTGLKKKNRFKNIVPYDHNRVKLLDVDRKGKYGDYVNASYVKGYKNAESYIASHGPSTDTVCDFWQMVWEQQVQVILMLTNMVESGKTKCEQYWSEFGPKQYRDVSVTLDQERTWLDYNIRQFTLSHKKDVGSRTVTQCHFSSWPDHGVPEHAAPLLRFRRKVREAMCPGSMTLVHCSAGVGRTGTYLALDWLLLQAEAEGGVDVYNCVHTLREYRMHMVQTVAQYAFIYTALHEAFTVGHTALPVHKVQELFSKLNQRNSMTHTTFLDSQYQILQNHTPGLQDRETMGARTATNKEKNRSAAILPGDRHRVKIFSKSVNGSDYINAVFVHSNRRQNGFIATQWPLQGTVEDFWRMAIDYNISDVIVLENREPCEEFPKFYPTGQSTLAVQDISVKHIITSCQDNLSIHEISLQKGAVKEPEAVYANIKPESGQKLRLWQVKSKQPEICLSTVVKVNKHLGQSGRVYMAPVVVVCGDGASLCGQFIAMCLLLNMVDTEHEVDVFYVAQVIRKSRPEFIGSQEQYLNLHHLIKKYIDSVKGKET